MTFLVSAHKIFCLCEGYDIISKECKRLKGGNSMFVVLAGGLLVIIVAVVVAVVASVVSAVAANEDIED